MRATGVAVLVGLGLALPAAAQMQERAEPVCTGTPAPLPAGLSGWADKVPLSAVGKAAQSARATLTIGKAAEIALLPTPKVTYPVRPEKPGGSVSHGGLVGFTVATAGTYRVALGSGAWIDVVRGGKPVVSTGHGHGPDCSGIRKMVDFPLTPGAHLLEIAGNGAPTIAVMVARLP